VISVSLWFHPPLVAAPPGCEMCGSSSFTGEQAGKAADQGKSKQIKVNPTKKSLGGIAVGARRRTTGNPPDQRAHTSYWSHQSHMSHPLSVELEKFVDQLPSRLPGLPSVPKWRDIVAHSGTNGAVCPIWSNGGGSCKCLSISIL
jgi:hypothetical protein